eukprot:CAMPEP_0197267830 /NCGR_PEP_ID=MMETSP1432-20130617/3815_1 /TAXON_ID=44447 /ORGANISM="Pseudo-nitzschia delicatissima, Strain UNC1205" /LENGTH=317 /DNA_ID=CAMNT_0042732815 /DNA_START=84 /DNA_END=1037 /DNA_ORIENTATION=-
MVMRVGVENRTKLIFHLGESMEINYKLQGYGIPFEHVPISWTGKVKVQYLKQWMRLRKAIEQKCAHDKLLQRQQQQEQQQQQQQQQQRKRSCSEATSGDESNNSVTSHSSMASNSHGKNNDIIECPQLHDVIFRQGTSGTSHSGNVTFRSLIESIVLAEHHKQYEREQEQLQQQKLRSKSSNNKQAKAKRPKQLASEIYDEHQLTFSTGRFLIWNNEKGWWNTLTDKEQICMKIEYMIREFQKVAQKRGVLKPKKQNGSSKKHGSNVVYLQSETSMFREQDGNPLFAANKRQRLNAVPDDDKSNMECFGMQFASCFT